MFIHVCLNVYVYISCLYVYKQEIYMHMLLYIHRKSLNTLLDY